MNTASRLTVFVAILAAGFGAAAAVGAAVGPIEVGGDATTHIGGVAAAPDQPRGLAVAEAGKRLLLDTTSVEANLASTFGFSIVDDRGTPVMDFEELHERPLHLIVLSRNLVDYLHLHPSLNADGHWSVDLPGLAPGSYRVFADFQPVGSANLTLGADISVPGSVETVPLPAPNNIATIGRYTVTMDAAPTVGDSNLSFTVELDGEVVRTEPYLGAAGHLVAIRDGDLAYLHVHPHEGGVPEVSFTGEFPTAGTYRLFFDFSHNGIVRTASFTVDVSDGADGATMDQREGGH